MISNGVGLMLASSICGYIFNHTVTDKTPEIAITQWHEFWYYPAGVAVVVSVMFFIMFKDTDLIFNKKETSQQNSAGANAG